MQSQAGHVCVSMCMPLSVSERVSVREGESVCEYVWTNDVNNGHSDKFGKEKNYLFIHIERPVHSANMTK